MEWADATPDLGRCQGARAAPDELLGLWQAEGTNAGRRRGSVVAACSVADVGNS